MAGLGTIVNVLAIVAGGTVGLIIKRFLSSRITDTVMQGVGLAVVIIGLSGALSAAFKVVDGVISTEYILLMIISLAVGALAGELIGIEEKLNKFAKFCERSFVKSGEKSTFAQGLVTATLVYCVGSMAIIGSFQDGINMNRDVLFAKSALDGITSVIFASTMGAGVLFSAIIVGVYQGVLTLIAVLAAPFFSNDVIMQISLVGSVLIMSLGLNMLEITKIKVSNLLPAIFIPVIYYVIQLII